MGSSVTDIGNDAGHIENLEKVALRSTIKETAREPETVVWIAVDGLNDVRDAKQSFPVEMIGIKRIDEQLKENSR